MPRPPQRPFEATHGRIPTKQRSVVGPVETKTNQSKRGGGGDHGRGGGGAERAYDMITSVYTYVRIKVYNELTPAKTDADGCTTRILL